MATIVCSKGHIYNSDEYASCPYCNNPAGFMDLEGAPAPAAPGMADNRTFAPSGYGAPQNAGSWQVPQAAAQGPQLMPDSFDGGGSNRTVAVGGAEVRQETNKTVGYFKKTASYDPIVGWLVCIEGDHKGQDYHIWARINTIGRNDSNDVSIKGDESISREKHARIAFDPKHTIYTLIPGENINNIYLNDQPVYASTVISAYDTIDFGSSKFIFIPLCGENFHWEEEK